ncbi:hypothetical protein [Inhella gelatinilytica]|uniref:Lipoprotein n=1 Tax=Inhella gelatinilytica TaxID=2795030 RepID=A0A931NDS7_9BURK|nr:hypothetical protein [Inhella gelatinilytica]MBH9551751.1 hypothetical protein [Inhella gelatinilytica]
MGKRGLWGSATVLALVACGGGGSSTPPAPPPPPPPTVGSSCDGTVQARWDAEPLVVGRSTEVHLVSCGAVLDQIQWTQTAGATLDLISSRSQSLSVTPTTAGSVGLQVRFRTPDGTVRTGTTTLAIAPNDLPRGVLTRGDPSVWSGVQFSVRAWAQGYTSSELAGSTIRWSQVSGPTVDLSTGNDLVRVVLKAPEVAQDSLLVLRATIKLASGAEVSDDFRMLVQPQPNRAAAPLFDTGTPSSRVVPYLESGPHAAALSRCIYNPSLSANPNNLCALRDLPLLGQAGAVPTIEQVMQRVLVSHDWMGQVFERFLREQDPQGDVRRMLASTTAVVLGNRVRPSFYWSATGAIYIDAAYLWMTPEQRDTLSEAADPRAANGPNLQYTVPWRYVLNNDYPTPSRPISARGSRPLEEMRYDLSRLMYHELAHAGDFLPPRTHTSLDSSLLVYQAVTSQTASVKLQAQLPFFSQVMVDLGRVLFYGVTATAQQNAMTPGDVAALFAADRVTSDYSYSLAPGQTVPREDAAMLVEEALMQLRYGVLRDVAITNKFRDGMSSADLIVTWGQRGRIGEASIRPRLKLVLDDIMPWITQADIDRLATPLPMRAGQSWGANLVLSGPSMGVMSAAQRAREDELQVERLRRPALH